MADQRGHDGLPGLTTKRSQQSRKVLVNEEHFMESSSVTVDSAAVDAAGVPTTTLRPGLILTRVIAGGNTGKYVPVDHADAPAATFHEEVIINTRFINMFGVDGVTVEDKQTNGWIHGIVDNAQIIFSGAGAAEITEIKGLLPMVHFKI